MGTPKIDGNPHKLTVAKADNPVAQERVHKGRQSLAVVLSQGTFAGVAPGGDNDTMRSCACIDRLID